MSKYPIDLIEAKDEKYIPAFWANAFNEDLRRLCGNHPWILHKVIEGMKIIEQKDKNVKRSNK